MRLHSFSNQEKEKTLTHTAESNQQCCNIESTNGLEQHHNPLLDSQMFTW